MQTAENFENFSQIGTNGKSSGRMTLSSIQLQLKRFWTSPFPLTPHWPDLSVRLGLISGLVMFGLWTMAPELGVLFGLELVFVCVITALTFRLLAIGLFDGKRWTAGRESIFLLAYLTAIGLTLMGWLNLRGVVHIHLGDAIRFLTLTPVIGSVPILLDVQMTRNRLLKNALAQAQSFSEQIQAQDAQITQTVTIEPDTGRKLTISAKHFSHARARQNYCEVFLRREQELFMHTVRIPMSRLEAKLAPIGAIRCHRSWLVQPDQIHHTRTDAKGCRLALVGVAYPVPVSRAGKSRLA